MKERYLWIWGVVAASLIGLLYLLEGILMPFLTGLLVAYAMNPAVSRLQRWGLPRGMGSIIMISSLFLFIGLLLCIAIPFLETELLRLAARVPQYGERLITVLQPFLDQIVSYIRPSDFERLQNLASTYIGDIVTWGLHFLATLFTNGLALANLLSLVVITPFVAFYCLRDWDKIISALDKCFPRTYQASLRRLFTEINATIGGFAKGQALVCLVMGIFYCIALTMVGLDFSLVVGTVIGIVTFIPYIGALLGFTLSMGIALAQFPDWMSVGSVAAVFCVGQVLEGYIFVPYFVGDRIGLHPVWIIFALLAGGVLYGFVGLLFALPIAAAIGVLLRHGLQLYFQSSYYKKAPSSLRKTSR